MAYSTRQRNSKRLLVGLSGPEGAGKSTLAKLLVREYGCAIVPFAKPLKDMLAALGIHERHLWGTPEDKAAKLDILGGRTARHAMQTLGTEWGRVCIDDGLWMRAWAEHASKHLRVVADDVRFENEADAIRHMGGLIIRIMRSEWDLNLVPKHPSENFQAIAPDVTIINDGTIADLRAKLAVIVGQYGRLSARRRAA